MQQFLRASTYMLPVSMVLANIYQPYKVRIAMFFCYLFQHGLLIWKLFLVISIFTVTSFKWQFFFFLSRAKTQVMHNGFCFWFWFFLLHFTFKTFVIDWVSLISAHMSLECRLKRLTVNIWGLFWDLCWLLRGKQTPIEFT